MIWWGMHGSGSQTSSQRIRGERSSTCSEEALTLTQWTAASTTRLPLLQGDHIEKSDNHGCFPSWLIELTGCEARQTSIGLYKAALSLVERTVSLHIVLFNVLAPNFYWLVVHMHFSTLCVLCTVKANEQEIENETYNKEDGRVS